MASPTPLTPTMRAAQWRTISNGIEKNLKVTTNARFPTLPKDHTLVKVSYASLNHLDYKVAELPFFSTFITKPATPGLDFSGLVVSTTLDTLRPGQRVFGRTEPPVCGTLAEYVVVGKAGIAALPEGVALRDAACVGICGIAAFQALAPFVKPGSRVLINGGSGGVGIFAIHIAKALGCARVTAVCSGQNAEFCRSLGADDIFDYKKENLVMSLKRKEEFYDHILDTVFQNGDLYWQCHHYLAPGGTYVSVGLPLQFKTFRTLIGIYILPGFLGGGKRKFKFHSVTANTQDCAQVGQWIKEGKVRPVIEEEFELENAGKAYGKLKTERTVGKIVVRVCGEPD
ncbi:zinc-type alcohol dehydrogenase-like protein [Colletotrichum truncatum]|uniref:Zinc-type alcohol dehydrogenase-like protein n=1 Tax=Colletotrichum truncatum TaxID=5467 RepID=A0ACC3YWA2_COLTU|nr:zinc-type alcohol dehydrogenase-like protein [Colletotrichum truncatum]KAF6791199.1 zinc-type alcohol dehydrogenase-like protein [Colletotrichum truncatum]